MAPSSRPHHDALYHRLFSHPGVVAQLLRDFVAGPGEEGIWLTEFDLDGMQRLNTKFHAEAGQRREGDMIWRIPRRDGSDSYLVLLLEFQSTPDQHMALRVLTYASLLWQQLVLENRLGADGKLPPVLPIVLHNGDRKWGAPVTVRTLVALPTDSVLWRWQPDLSYHLIDAGAFSDAELEERDSLPALWFRLETARSPARLVAVTDAVIAWLARHPGYSAARTLVAEFLRTATAPINSELRMPEDLQEVRNMLAARVEEWKQTWRLEARREGQEEGRQEGRQQGRQEGRQEGEAALLLRQLERRFGALPGSVLNRVSSAGITELEHWGIRLLDAVSLDDVLETPPTE